MDDIDVARQIGAVDREVHGGDHEGKPAKTVIVAQTYPTSVEDLWNAVTTADRIPRWLMPITGELTLGGRYQLVGNASGTVLECDAPRFLKVTWEYGGKVSWVTATIEQAANNSARLTVEHIAHVEEHWARFGPGAVGIGWDLMLLALARHIETGRATVAEEGVQWMMSGNAKDFMKRSGDAWQQADVASGTDPETARATAEQTFAAYTGGSPE